MDNLIVAIVLLAILAGAITYIVRAKKRGVRCVGCSSCSCNGQTSAGSCCSCSEEK